MKKIIAIALRISGIIWGIGVSGVAVQDIINGYGFSGILFCLFVFSIGVFGAAASIAIAEILDNSEEIKKQNNIIIWQNERLLRLSEDNTENDEQTDDNEDKSERISQ